MASNVSESRPVVEEREVAIVPATDHAPRIASRNPADFPVPNGREEEWRFTPLKPFARILSGDASAASLAVTSQAPEGVTVTTVAAGSPELEALPLPIDRPSALAVANAPAALKVSIGKDVELSEPVLVSLVGESADDLVWGQVIVEIGTNSRATVVLQHSGAAAYSEHLSVLVGDGAGLQLVHVQTWADDSVHAAHVAARVGRDASLKTTQVSLGGTIRILETVEYTGTGGAAELHGLYFADGEQHIEHRLFVDHALPNCRSNVLYKGALQGAGAHTVWVGDVLIRAKATGTDTYELNRNLVLTEGARADSVPNLEIETGEIVGAGHASATGRFDDEQLFYLQARGIPESVARRLVVRGFFGDVINKIGVPDLESELMAAVEARLGQGDPLYDFSDGEESGSEGGADA